MKIYLALFLILTVSSIQAFCDDRNQRAKCYTTYTPGGSPTVAVYENDVWRAEFKAWYGNTARTKAAVFLQNQNCEYVGARRLEQQNFNTENRSEVQIKEDIKDWCMKKLRPTDSLERVNIVAFLPKHLRATCIIIE